MNASTSRVNVAASWNKKAWPASGKSSSFAPGTLPAELPGVGRHNELIQGSAGNQGGHPDISRQMARCVLSCQPSLTCEVLGVKCGGGFLVGAWVLLDDVEVGHGCGGLILREGLGLCLRGAQAGHGGIGREGHKP